MRQARLAVCRSPGPSRHAVGPRGQRSRDVIEALTLDDDRVDDLDEPADGHDRRPKKKPIATLAGSPMAMRRPKSSGPTTR